MRNYYVRTRYYYIHVYYTHGVFIRQKYRMKLFQKKFLVKSDVKICLASVNLINCRLSMNKQITAGYFIWITIDCKWGIESFLSRKKSASKKFEYVKHRVRKFCCLYSPYLFLTHFVLLSHIFMYNNGVVYNYIDMFFIFFVLFLQIMRYYTLSDQLTP